MSDLKLFGPFTIKMDVVLTDGENFAVADFQMQRSEVPSVEAFREGSLKVEAQVKATMTDDWRLCTKREYFDYVTREATGQDMGFAMPGHETEWDDA